jgi:hypothetical protein
MIHVALCAGALSACAIDDDEALEVTTQEVKPAPDFETILGFDNNCSVVSFISNWIVPQSGHIDYQFSDLTTGDGFLYTSYQTSPQTTDFNQLFDITTAAVGRPHRFLLTATLYDESGQQVYQDRDRLRVACSFDVN